MRAISKTITDLVEGTSYSEVLKIGIMENVNGVEANVRVSAKSGTSPTLDVTIQYTFDNVNWIDNTTFTQFTDMGTETKASTLYGIAQRLKFVVGGSDTPKVTFDYHIAAR